MVPRLIAACFALALLDLVLVFQNRELSARLHAANGALQAAAPEQLKSPDGAHFPTAMLAPVRSQPVTFRGLPKGSGTLLFVSSTACDYCDLARPTWERAARVANDTALQIFELVLEATPTELTVEYSNFPMLTATDGGTAIFEQIAGVPAALLLDRDGTVLQTIYGAEPGVLEESVQQFLAQTATTPK